MNPCCDRRTMVAMIAMIDMTFGIILLGLSAHSLFVGEISGAEFSHTPSIRLLHLIPVIMNTFQILVSFHLLTSAMQIDPFTTLVKTQIWYQGAILTLTCLAIKFLILLILLIYFAITPPFDGSTQFTLASFGRTYISVNFLMVVTICEIMSKMVSLLLIREYLEGLRREAFHLPNVRYYSGAGSGQVPRNGRRDVQINLGSTTFPPPPPPPAASSSIMSPYPSATAWIVPTHKNSVLDKKSGSGTIYIANFPSCRTNRV